MIYVKEKLFAARRLQVNSIKKKGGFSVYFSTLSKTRKEELQFYSLFVFISQGSAQVKVYAISSTQKKAGDALFFIVFQIRRSVAFRS